MPKEVEFETERRSRERSVSKTKLFENAFAGKNYQI